VAEAMTEESPENAVSHSRDRNKFIRILERTGSFSPYVRVEDSVGLLNV
jgi:hypothetical protein